MSTEDTRTSNDLLRDWLKFTSDVTPSCAAGDEWLRGLQERTEAALRTPDEVERLQARCKDLETFIAAMGWKFDGECFGATDEPAASKERCNCPNSSYGIKHTGQCYEAQIESLQHRLSVAYARKYELNEELNALRAANRASNEPPAAPKCSFAEVWPTPALVRRLREFADGSNYGDMESLQEALLVLADDFASGTFVHAESLRASQPPCGCQPGRTPDWIRQKCGCLPAPPPSPAPWLRQISTVAYDTSKSADDRIREIQALWEGAEQPPPESLCPNCEKDEVGTFTADDWFLYGVEKQFRLVAKDVLFFRCMACGLEFTGEDGEQKRLQAVRDHLARATATKPGEQS